MLYPAVAEAAHRAGADAVGLIGVGCSAGLIQVDRVGITYGDGRRWATRRRRCGCRAGSWATGPSRRGACPRSSPGSASTPTRVDVTDADDARWLRACLWPDRPEQAARLEAELALAATAPSAAAARRPRRGAARRRRPGARGRPARRHHDLGAVGPPARAPPALPAPPRGGGGRPAGGVGVGRGGRGRAGDPDAGRPPRLRPQHPRPGPARRVDACAPRPSAAAGRADACWPGSPAPDARDGAPRSPAEPRRAAQCPASAGSADCVGRISRTATAAATATTPSTSERRAQAADRAGEGEHHERADELADEERRRPDAGAPAALLEGERSQRPGQQRGQQQAVAEPGDHARRR